MDLLNSENICLRHCLRLLCNEGKVTAAVFEIETVSKARCESEHISRDITSQPWVLTQCCCRAAQVTVCRAALVWGLRSRPEHHRFKLAFPHVSCVKRI